MNKTRILGIAACLATAFGVRAPAVFGADPFADALVSFTPGAHAGYGADRLPQVVLGPPHGGGALQGSLDTLALGDGGSIVLRFDEPICDAPGADFIIFENAFHAGTADGPLFFELGIVAVSTDGDTFVELPYDPLTYSGLAGRTPVFSTPENGIDPADIEHAGGDAFDLATIHVERISQVRITDAGSRIADSGDHVPPGNSGGFDLDAIVAVHACATATPTLQPSAGPVATASATATHAPSPELEDMLEALFESRDAPAYDLNQDLRQSVADLVQLIWSNR